MSSQAPKNVVELMQFAVDLGIVKDGKVVTAGRWNDIEKLSSAVIETGRAESAARHEAWEEEKLEYSLGVASGCLDVGQDDYVGDRLSSPANVRRLERALRDQSFDDGGKMVVPSCFYMLCKHMGVKVDPHCYSVSELSGADSKKLRSVDNAMVGYTMYSSDDVRNHVVPVVAHTKPGVVQITVDGGDGNDNCLHGVTSPQEFFNPGGRFYTTKFYADDPGADRESGNGTVTGMGGTGFGPGEDTSAGDGGIAAGVTSHGPMPPPGPQGFGRNVAGNASTVNSGYPSGGSGSGLPPAPESVADYDVGSGSANTSGGVVRAKKRVIAARGSHEKDVAALKSYRVTGVTMFNNVDELYLDTISRSFAQEVIEDLLDVWGVPKDEPESVTYAEDMLWLFIVARTASNKADYNVAFDIPTKSGAVEADFSKFSNLLASKYGITRRNFARGVADDLRAYLNRPENQFVKTKSAARIYADPQYGDLSFDGSTGCTGMTTSEQRFTKLLEDRNLYERADVRADGASDMLMQGIHGGVRSVVSR